MTLHYRKLLIASVALPIVVVGGLFLGTPTLQRSRESAAFDTMRGQLRHMEMLLAQVDAMNTQQELQEPLKMVHEVAENQSESLIDLREAVADPSRGTTPVGWIAALSTLTGLLGTMTSIVFSWRQDMRDAKREGGRLRNATPSPVVPLPEQKAA